MPAWSWPALTAAPCPLPAPRRTRLLYSQAKELLPELPGISQASVQAARGGVFMGALSPGVVGNVAQVRYCLV